MPTPENNSNARIFNEGRVVGLSAYELYVRQHLSEFPEMPAATEREWLAASLSSGSSMILKVPAVVPFQGDYALLDVPLPAGSSLVACNTIVASFFSGEVGGITATNPWATKVTKYSGAFLNNNTKYPGNTTESNNSLNISSVAAADVTPSSTELEQLEQYMRIVDGVVIQPGDWTAVASGSRPPRMTDLPKFGQESGGQYIHTEPTIRLVIKGEINSNGPLVLLTGFTSKYVVAGEVNVHDTVPSNNPQDGDFLGPAVFPWANKIIFSVPNEYIRYFSAYWQRTIGNTYSSGDGYIRDQSAITSEDSSVVDMRTVNPADYYTNSAYSDAAVPILVDNKASKGLGAATLLVYRKKDVYPPALYSAFVTSTGQQNIYPLDVVAPGSVKFFESSGVDADDIQLIEDYQDTYPHTFAYVVTPYGELRTVEYQSGSARLSPAYHLTRSSATIAGATDAYIRALLGISSSATYNLPQVASDDYHHIFLDLTTSSEIPQTISFRPAQRITLTSSNSFDMLSWSVLLYALANDRSIDLLGQRLRDLKNSLIREMQTGASAPYIEFGPGDDPDNPPLRLYVSNTEPETADVPEGSIGIGW